MKKSHESIITLFESLLIRMLKAEKEILKQLKVVSQTAQANSLQSIFETHTGETENQIQRLKSCLKHLGVPKDGKNIARINSEAIHGIMQEGEHTFKEYAQTHLHDYVLASGAQSLEMGEIAAYKTLISLAVQCGFEEIEDLLEETLKEEINAYELLKTFSEEEARKLKKSA